LKAQDAALEKQLETARPRDVPGLEEQREQTKGELELQTAIEDALGRITSISTSASETGFSAQIVQLERSAPALATGKPTAVSPTLENLSAAKSGGVAGQAEVLFALLGTKRSIETLSKEADALHQEATDVRAPLINALRRTIAQGEALSQQVSAAPPATPAAESPTRTRASTAKTPVQPAITASDLAATRKSFDTLTATFKTISAASVPLSQEIVAIEQSQASFQVWQRAVAEEYTSIMWSLLTRVITIAIALLLIFVLGEVWRRATTKYIHDVRRRRQILVIRRLAIGFLSGLVMIFGLVTQFSSLATFAGFITAGLAVGLQTILLSVAAYFFIIGRYGVKVGDRITIAGVTGDVAEVGLVRFYVLELAGSSTDLYPSGRVAVFSNAVLFQAGTPLYKQLPGTEYLWHELTVKLTADADYRPAVQAMLNTVQKVYDGYRHQIERQHQELESWMDSSFASPEVQSSLQLVDGGLQFWARFPVLIRQVTETDNRMTESLLETIASDPKIKAVVGAPPVIKAAVKG
jgi:small-conductance mechanosensitive channel